MQATKAVNHYEKIVTATLKLAETKGWGGFSVEDVAKQAKIPLKDVQALATDKSDLLLLIGRNIDCKVEGVIADSIDPDAPIKDRLFEALMARFDVLQDMRAGFQPILEALCHEPKDVAVSLPHLGRSMVQMLKHAGLPPTGVSGALQIIGLMAVYVRTLKVWQTDESADMAKTMVALDQNLAQAERIAGWLRI